MTLRRVALAWFVAGALGCQPSPAPPPRIVLVTIDTLRADHVGAYGASFGATPALDALAEAGVTFETALSPTPLTLPSHTTLLSGLDPPKHGVHHNGIFEVDASLPLLAEALQGAGFATGGFVGAVVLDRQYGLARGFDVYGDEMSLRHATAGGYAERRGAKVVDDALAWAKSTDGHFFLWVHLYDPHADYDAPPRIARRFTDPYVAEIAYADAQLGRLRQELEARFPGDTLWIVTSDHGESRGEHRELTHGYGIHEVTQRVPLVLAGAGLPAGARLAAPVRLADVTPTVLAMSGLAPFPDSDGLDLRPLLSGESTVRSAYFETLAANLDHGWSALYGIREGSYKLIRAPQIELYDLAHDPGERVNLVAAEADRARTLDARLSERLAGAAPAAPLGALSPERQRQLASLGYLPAGDASETPLGIVAGLHPRDGMPKLVELFRGRTLMMAGRYREAARVFESTGLDSPDVNVDRAWVASRSGNGAAAEGFARAAAGAPWAPYVLGEALRVQGRFDEAEASLREAIANLPSEGDPLASLGRVKEEQGRPEEAAALYREGIERRASSLEAVWRLAALEIERGDSDAAQPLLARLGEAGVHSPDATERLVRAELHRGDVEAARRRLDAALRSHASADALLALKRELEGNP